MTFIITFMKRLIPKELPKPVGRWRIEKCNKQMNEKIDLSNEDHCGPCGQYAIEKKLIVSKNWVKSRKIYIFIFYRIVVMTDL